jgi:hypothetical protein
MSKYKIEIEIDVDFDKIFSEIPEGLFSEESKGSDEYYEKEVIGDVLKDAHIEVFGIICKDKIRK